VEAVEHLRQVGVGDARPTVEHGQGDPVRGAAGGRIDDHLDRARGLVELARVVDQVGNRTVQAGARGLDHRRRCARHVDGAGTATPHPLRDLAGEVDEIEALGRLIAQLARRHRHQFVDQLGQLGDLEVEVVEDLPAHVGRHVRMPLHHRQVGAQARERGTQFVTGVLDEALLFGP
jgi:hypothetical protein